MNFDFYDSPELLDVQRKAFYTFLKQGIPELLSQQFPIKAKSGNYSIELLLNDKHVKLITPDSSPRDCILKMKTYSCKLYARVKLVCKKDEPSYNTSSIVYQSNSEWVLLGQLPMMTKRGHFIINGSPRVIVHQVVRSPGIYFQKLINKDDRKMSRYYGDIIPLKGVWVRLQMTKKGRIEAKFKKGKKVQVEFLQKCLQVIEGAYSSLSNVRENINSMPYKSTICKPKVINSTCNSSLFSLPLASAFAPSMYGQEGGYECKAKLMAMPMPMPMPFGQGQGQGHGKGQRKNIYSGAKQGHVQKAALRSLYKKTRRLPLENENSKSPMLYEDYSTLLDTRKSRANTKSEHDAFITLYDKLYRTTQDKELEDWQKKKSNLSFFKGLNPENAFKRKKCSENLFASFKLSSRYDLGLLGRDKINEKFNLFKSFPGRKSVSFLKSSAAFSLFAREAAGLCQRYTKERAYNFSCVSITEDECRDHVHTPYKFSICNPYDDAKRSFARKFARRIAKRLKGPRTSVNRKAANSFVLPKAYKYLQIEDLIASGLQIYALYGVVLPMPMPFGQGQGQDYVETSTSARRFVWSSSSYKSKISTCKQIYKPTQQPFNLSQLTKAYGSDNNKQKKNKLNTQLTSRDLFSASVWLYQLRKGERNTDDIDHSQNRRVRTAGELLQTQFENGVERLKNLLSTKLQEWRGSSSRSIFSSIFKSRYKIRYSAKSLLKTSRESGFSYNDLFSSCTPPCVALDRRSMAWQKTLGQCKQPQSINAITDSTEKSYKISVKELFSTKPITGALREFFGSNPLSQYMDQTNPLAEITHKRRISSLGVGGVSRDSAGMAIRGIHPTHYGRICPIETPEGKNAGLVNSLAFYTKLDTNGFLKTPYYRVIDGQIQSALGFSFTSAKAESLTGLYIAPSDLQKSSNNILRSKNALLEAVPVRVTDNQLDVFKKENPTKVQLMGISPIQMISVATSLIPFLEHNDANRALMGSNMQRQAVPLMIAERPIVGTGLESIVIVESGHITESLVAGFADQITATKVDIARLIFRKKKETSRALKSFFIRPFVSPRLINQYSYKSPKGLQIDDLTLSGIANAKLLCKSSYKCLQTKNWINFGAGAALPFGHAEAKRSFASPKIYKSKMMAMLQGQRTCKKICKPLHRNFAYASFGGSGPGKKQSMLTPFVQLHTQGANQSKLSKYIRPIHSRFLSSVKQDSFLFSLTKLLTTFSRSNQNTCITEKPLIRQFDWVQKGDILSDCSASNKGELSVGKNILVAYIPWEGYNFEDAIVISERLVREHVYTSLHIERYTFQAQDLNDGHEWFTKNLPGIEDRLVEHLEESGLPKIGSFVKEGDILVGKVRYLNKKPSSPYERLLCDILGEKNFAARNKSLYVPKGVEARVIYHKVINQFDNETLPSNISLKELKEKDRRFTKSEGYDLRSTDVQISDLQKDLRLPSAKKIYKSKMMASPSSKQSDILQGIYPQSNAEGVRKPLLTSTNQRFVKRFVGQRKKMMAKGQKQTHTLQGLQRSNPQQRNPAKTVNIFLGEKRVIQVGDKISGRHGNKGVISTILPRQDMPYLPDGTPIDLILNPLGVPSRMNVGQVLECLLGLASDYLKQNFKITAFDERYGVEASKSLVFLKLYQARLQSGQNWLFQVDFPGKTRLVDGRSGECFDQWITVGKAYILKLIHMVSEKIHARSTGPYALITQQPLRGRSNKGGQRLGEMEVWALEGFGAAYTLQELLTKKSDDYFGRNQIVDSILPKPPSIVDTLSPNYRVHQNRAILGHPEIFKVLLCELQALCLDLGVYVVTPESYQRGFLGVVH